MKGSKKAKLLRITLVSLISAGLIGLFLAQFLFRDGGFTAVLNSLSASSKQTPKYAVIPKPANCSFTEETFILTDTASIYINGNNTEETDEIYNIGEYLSEKLKTSTGYPLSVIKSDAPSKGNIYLTTAGGDSSLGQEGYQLDITNSLVTLKAFTPEGLFRGIQTLRQLFPAAIEKNSLVTDTAWTLPAASITDYPAYPWRGMMLDTARHFIEVEDVKRTIDLIAQYKMNKFHMHLSDDQGWRIEIKSWPELTTIGGSSEVGGGRGGFYTQEEYSDIVNYAKERYITVIPEIDMPGHTNAALASYGELNPDGKKKELYTGIDVGFSSLMCRSEVTYAFVNDVIRELAALTPGDYIHIGGDEASSTSKEDYDYFIGRVNEIVSSYGKKTIGWNPFDTSPGTTSESLLQKWNPDSSAAEAKGMKMILSPPPKAYIDMKYDENTPLGLQWAGFIPTKTAYEWDPSDFAPSVHIAGIECPLWSETIKSMNDIEFLAFPRLPGHAEIGWTPKNLRNWKEYKLRLKVHGERMENQEINYYKDPDVSW